MTAPDPLGFTVRPLDPLTDIPLVHRWVTHPKSAFWQMPDFGPEDVARAYTEITEHPHHHAFIGHSAAGEPVFLMESYDPAEVELVGLYDAGPGDVGMHFLVAPTDTPVHGFTRAVITAVLRTLFADPATERVVVEPDIRNTAVHALNAYAGFSIAERIRTPEKEAFLSFCTRDAFERSAAMADRPAVGR
ncbi:GNAT family N-acetyltransferase [Streptomyces sp. NPDC058953]|uniref:GNAT family N-acetyltransferase n=1 Tax=unclassified Streptomyces TaxID=2593676 RepID=UPI00368A225F